MSYYSPYQRVADSNAKFKSPTWSVDLLVLDRLRLTTVHSKSVR